MSERRIAAFDFDRTITKRDTLVPFLYRLAGPLQGFKGTLWSIQGFLSGGSDVERRRALAKGRFFREVFAGRPIDALRSEGERYAATLPSLYRPAMVAKVDWHRSEGHELILVTASLRLYAEPAARALGFDHVIAVDLELDPDRRATGQMSGVNIRGREKARRLLEHVGHKPDEMWAYGDSSGDRELLAMADHPTWIGRSKA